MNRSDKIEQVSASLFAVHRDLRNPRKDAKGQVRGRANYEYLSLPALVDHLRPLLKDAQLYITQEITGSVEVTTTVWHLSGQFISFGPTYIAAAGDAQQQGSAMTYCRRYALAAVFNLAADEDDDAASTSGRRASQTQPSQSDPSPSTSAPMAGDTGAEDVGPDPDLSGEGSDGSGPATNMAWANLLAAVDGKPKVAVAIINEKNGTHYKSYAQARAEATQAELVKAVGA